MYSYKPLETNLANIGLKKSDFLLKIQKKLSITEA